MAMSNRQRVGKAFDLLSEGLYDPVDEVMTGASPIDDWPELLVTKDVDRHGGSKRIMSKHDVQTQLRAITEFGRHFKGVLSPSQTAYASELRQTRNQWAHQEPFSTDDTVRALDTMERLLRAVNSNDSADDVRKLRDDLMRSDYEDRTRKEVKRTDLTLAPGTGIASWREVIQPHDDVARGAFNASEFAADLHLVHSGQAISPEYSDPVEFFNRTYLTEGLRDLLSRALRRLNGDTGAGSIVNLQTNFGGGKTHSMLALYHLFSGTTGTKYPQEIQELIAANGNPDLKKTQVRRVALVGTSLSPGSSTLKLDGTEVHTLWGELAWQLGGREAYDLIANDDKQGTNPGGELRTLLERYSPALILIDEWVAYARQLITDKQLPAGSFETQFTFAQALSEAVSSVPGTMLVVSIPASEDRQDGRGNDIEVGGEHGQKALEQLQNVIRRVADQWRPSSKDESFEIVRRRLFQDPDAEGLAKIAVVARHFANMYRENSKLFPREAASPNDDYEKRIKSSYPLHPELLDRLYEDWSTLDRFQRTRGVLKLVSSIVHELWASNDSSPLILPGNVPLDATSVNTDLAQYLEDQWKPIIDTDIDGTSSTAYRVDLERSNLGQRSITRRIARTIFMGAAPRSKSNNKGLDKQYVWLGTAIPGDALGNYGTAIEHLSQRSTYFYEDQGHYWFDTQPSISKTASDYAERLREDDETVWNEITERLKGEERKRGAFDRVHIAPAANADIPDLEEARLVIVHPRFSFRKNDVSSTAIQWVNEAVAQKGSVQRVHRNSLVFLVADKAELENLEAATRTYLAWKHVQDKQEELNLTTQQVKQAIVRVSQENENVIARIRSAFVWCLSPEQSDAARQFTVMTSKVADSGSDSLAQRVSSLMSYDARLISILGASALGQTLQNELRSFWNNKGEVTVGELWGFFTRYVYMPRLTRRSVLDEAIVQSLNTLLNEGEEFGIATGKDPETGRYKGLVIPPNANAVLQVTDSTILIEISHAEKQAEADAKIAAEKASAQLAGQSLEGLASTGKGASSSEQVPEASDESVDDSVINTRFFGTVTIDSKRYSRDITTVSKEIIDKLIGAGARIELKMDIQAVKDQGFTDSELRTIKENAKTLGFDVYGFDS